MSDEACFAYCNHANTFSFIAQRAHQFLMTSLSKFVVFRVTCVSHIPRTPSKQETLHEQHPFFVLQGILRQKDVTFVKF